MKQTGIQKALALFDNSPTKLAAAIGNDIVRQNIEHWLESGRVPADKCPLVSAATGIACKDLNDKVRWDLVKQRTAPSVARLFTAQEGV